MTKKQHLRVKVFAWALGLLYAMAMLAFLMYTGEVSAQTGISNTGVQLVKHFEGVSYTPYLEPTGKRWHIGYGHLLDGPAHGVRISEDTAEKLLRKDLKKAENAVQTMVKVPLEQHQYDALVSFVYNLGSGNFSRSRLLRKLNSGDYAGAANEFPRWVRAGGKKVKGLVIRRQIEKTLFTGGVDAVRSNYNVRLLSARGVDEDVRDVDGTQEDGNADAVPSRRHSSERSHRSSQGPVTFRSVDTAHSGYYSDYIRIHRTAAGWSPFPGSSSVHRIHRNEPRVLVLHRDNRGIQVGGVQGGRCAYTAAHTRGNGNYRYAVWVRDCR